MDHYSYECSCSDNSLHIFSKPPEIHVNMMSGGTSCKARVESPLKIDLGKFHEEESLKKLPSSPRRKKFSESKKKSKSNLKLLDLIGNPEEKKNEVFKKCLSKLKEKTKSKVLIFIESLKKRAYFTDYRNLKPYHYELIKDPAAFYKKNPNVNRINKSNSLHQISKLGQLFWMLPLIMLVKKRLKVFCKNLTTFLRNNKTHINPNGPFKVIWDLILMLMTCFQLFIFSIEHSYEIDYDGDHYLFGLTFAYYLDLLISLNTKVYTDGIDVTDRILIMKKIWRKNFFSNLLPCLVLSFINFSEYNQSLQFLNLVLCFKILKVRKLEQRLKELLIKTRKAEAIFQMINLIIRIAFWAHLIAVLWHYVGISSQKSSPDSMSWLKSKGIENTEWRVRYLYSTYWAVTTMLTVGYGDVTPTNSYEMLYNIGVMFVGCGIFGYTMNKISEILTHFHRESIYLSNQLSKVSFMLKDKKFPLEMQTKIKRYLKFVLKQELREDPDHENFVMNRISSELRKEIYLHTNVKYLKSVPAFKSFNENVLIMLARYMHKVCYSPEEVVYKEGDYADLNVYFVLKGNLKLTSSKDERTHSVWRKYKKGDYFGERELFSGIARISGVVSADFSSLFKLSRSDILQVLRKFPKDYEKFCEIKDKELLYSNYTQYDTVCISCGLKDHCLELCDFLGFKPGKQLIAYRYQVKEKLKARRFKRRKQRAKNALSQIELNVSAQRDFTSMYAGDEDLKEFYDIYSNNEDSFPDVKVKFPDGTAKDDEAKLGSERVVRKRLSALKTVDLRRINPRVKTEECLEFKKDGLSVNNETPPDSFKDNEEFHPSSFSPSIFPQEIKEEKREGLIPSIGENTIIKYPQNFLSEFSKETVNFNNDNRKALTCKRESPLALDIPREGRNKQKKKSTAGVLTEYIGSAINTGAKEMPSELREDVVRVFENYFPSNNVTDIAKLLISWKRARNKQLK